MQICGIKGWAEEDRPREKMLNLGKQSMTNAELLAIILGSGSRNKSALSLAKTLLSYSKNDLLCLSKLEVNDLCKFIGVGPAKAVSIMAAIELGKRTNETKVLEPHKITTSLAAYNQLKDVLEGLPHEEFWILVLNRRNKVVKRSQISKGGITGTLADIRLIFKMVIDNRGCSMIVAHNHPSGSTKPSKSDIKITRKIKEACKIMDIDLLDHLIVSNGSYLSFLDEGIL